MPISVFICLDTDRIGYLLKKCINIELHSIYLIIMMNKIIYFHNIY